MTVIISLGFSIFFVRIKPPLYQTATTVKVDRNSMMGLGMESMMYYGAWDNIETETQVITSFPVLLRAAKQLKMISDTIPQDTYPTDEGILNTLQSIRGSVSASLSGNTNIITIQAKSNSPKKAAAYANAVTLSYRNFCRDTKKAHATKTRSFIESQLERCRAELSKAESLVRTFEEQQDIPSINENSKITIEKSLQNQEAIKEIEEAYSIIEMQEKKLREFSSVDDIVKRFARANQEKIMDSVNASDSNALIMGWVSEFTDQDPGIQQLNRRLLELQLQLADQVSFYKKDHPSNREIEKRIKETTSQIVGEYQKKRFILDNKRNRLLQEAQEIGRELKKIPTNQMNYARLVRRLEVNEELHNLLTQKHQEAMINEAGIVDDVTIMSLATPPTSPVNKNMTKVAAIGVLFGLIVGLIFSILREVLDTSIGTIEEVERTIKLPVLAVIPHILDESTRKSSKKHKIDKQAQTSVKPNAILVTQLMPKDPSSEAFRILRTNIEYLFYDNPRKAVLMTSATMQEGKSTVISNLAIALAQEGKRVLLVGCNLRRPSMFRLFGLERGPGTADILIEKAQWQDCVRTVTDLILGGMAINDILKVPGLENLNFITYGQKPPNPVELLTSQKMNTFLSEAKEYYDIVLVDAPPILPVADSIVLSKKVDAVFLIYKVGKVPRNSLRLAKERLEAVSSSVLGVILNDIKPETTGIPHAGIYYQYHEKDSRKKNQKVSVHGKQLV